MGQDLSVRFRSRRSQYDEILFRNAARKGAQTIEGCRVTKVEFPAGDDVRIQTRTGDAERTWRAKFFIDASGRDTFLANRFGIKRRNRYHNSAAMYGHFTGAQRLPGKRPAISACSGSITAGSGSFR